MQHRPFLILSCPQEDVEVGKVQPDPSHGAAHTGGEKWAQVPAAGLEHLCSWELDKQPRGPDPPLGGRQISQSAKNVRFGVGETQVQIQLYHQTIP